MKDLDKKVIEVFNVRSFKTLADTPCKEKVLFGEHGNDIEKSERAITMSENILNHYFDGKNIYIRLTIWDKRYLKKYVKNIFNLQKYITDSLVNDDSIVLYYYINNYNFQLIEKIVKSIVNYELGLAPYLNATCYYFNFDVPVLVNVYDDRGLDIVLPKVV